MAGILVTGAGGFVGPHVLRQLRSQGHEVWATDRSDTHSTSARVCDLTDTAAVRALIDDLEPDAIVHLASVASVGRSFAAPQHTLQNNLLAACNLFEALRDRPRTRVLVVGSAEQYGRVDTSELPLGENQPFRPASPYAVSKIAQEYLALQYRTSYGLDVVLARSFNHSGPGQSDDFVLPAVAKQIALAEAGRTPHVVRIGNLAVSRDYLDVRDVARAYALLLEHGEGGQAYNVARGRAESLQDLVATLLAKARVALTLEPDPKRMRPADLPVLVGDSTRLRTRTHWQPEIPLETTLADVLDDWRQRVQGDGTAP
ncbi:MAG TPA: GDP-mannose 4,6-dehydratase [Candidatus Krumholzibacteria bacterium]|nr:GDP-mannose 4,6-dehydratase [Candidatus Krumholzibacteria bacterium]